MSVRLAAGSNIRLKADASGDSSGDVRGGIELFKNQPDFHSKCIMHIYIHTRTQAYMQEHASGDSSGDARWHWAV